MLRRMCLCDRNRDCADENQEAAEDELLDVPGGFGVNTWSDYSNNALTWSFMSVKAAASV